MDLTKREKRRLRLEKLRQESSEAQQDYEQRLEQQKKHEERKIAPKSKYYIIASVVAVLVIVAYSAYSFSKPGYYNNFTKCLTEKGAVMYGAMSSCKFTQGQKAMFGKSFKYINYHDFNELPGIKKTPTWVINGQWYENVQSFEKLSQITGCSLK